MTQKLELLAPAGSRAGLSAAIAAGADALYFGLGDFNARGAAANLSIAELPEIMELASLYEVKTYLTLNTLLRDAEMADALRLAEAAYRAGVDAVILQDKGLALLLISEFPDWALHGSTQMSLTHPEALYEAAELGLKRVILPRELSHDELALMTETARSLQLESEIFVQGALCVCVSGQCALSYFNGGRSANRGACAQACRLDYQLEVDGKKRADGPLLSPKDQALINELRAIKDMGIHSIKIEGRRRTPLYAATTCAIYRQVLDAIEKDDQTHGATAEQEKDLLLAFNRGGAFTRQWFANERKSAFLSGSWPGSHGIKLGPVVEIQPQNGLIQIRNTAAADLDADIIAGSVIALRDDYEQKELASAPIGKLQKNAGLIAIKAFHPQLLRQLTRGCTAYLMQSKRLQQNAAELKLPKRRVLDFNLVSHEHETFLLGQSGSWSSQVALQQDAQYPVLNQEKVVRSLSKLGESPFYPGKIKIDSDLKLPLSALNEARRQICAELSSAIVADKKRHPRVKDASATQTSGLREWLRPLILQSQAHTSVPVGKELRYFYSNTLTRELLEKAYRTADRLVLALDLVYADPDLREWVAQDKAGRIELALPLIFSRENRQNWQNNLKTLCQSAPRVLHCATAGGKAWTEEIPNLRWTQDSASHVMNRWAAIWTLAQGALSILPADELTAADCLELAQALREELDAWDLTQVETRFTLQLAGPRRAMYCRHCSLGLRREGCHACHGKRAELVECSSENVIKLVFHPHADCCTELLTEKAVLNQAFTELADKADWPGSMLLRYNICL